MKAYVDMWASPDGDDHEVDVLGILTALRAVPGVVRADRFFTGDDLVAIVESEAEESFEDALTRIDAIPDCAVSNVRLVRTV